MTTASAISVTEREPGLPGQTVGRVRPGGTLLFMGGTGGRRRDHACRSFRRAPPRCPP
jgi:hypothetical protein